MEVVLSAGAIASPQILMLSGIGPEDELKRHGIPIIATLPVGFHLQSHLGTGELIFSVEKTGLAANPLAIFSPTTHINYAKSKSGPLSSANQFEGLAFLKLGNSYSNRPDVELQLIASHVASDGGLVVKDHLGLSDKLFEGIAEQMSFQEGFTILPFLLHPLSQGRIWLRSNDPKAPPLIEPNYFAHPEDVLTLIKAINVTLELVEKGPMFREHGAKLIKRKNPFCTKYAFLSDAYWECVMRHNTLPVYHDIGTCAMGRVVDAELRILGGVSGLRVADASVFPAHISGNINTAVVMVAERLADFIKKDYEM